MVLVECVPWNEWYKRIRSQTKSTRRSQSHIWSRKSITEIKIQGYSMITNWKPQPKEGWIKGELLSSFYQLLIHQQEWKWKWQTCCRLASCHLTTRWIISFLIGTSKTSPANVIKPLSSLRKFVTGITRSWQRPAPIYKNNEPHRFIVSTSYIWKCNTCN